MCGLRDFLRILSGLFRFTCVSICRRFGAVTRFKRTLFCRVGTLIQYSYLSHWNVMGAKLVLISISQVISQVKIRFLKYVCRKITIQSRNRFNAHTVEQIVSIGIAFSDFFYISKYLNFVFE